MPRPSISRRSWFAVSAASVAAAACGRPEPTQIPDGGPEPGRPLSERGVRNLIALAELGAAIHYLHPSDQVQAAAWQPTMLAGVRGLESAETSEALAEGLRGLFGAVAPTVAIWRRADEDEASTTDLAAPACPDPEAPEDRARDPEKAAATTRGPEERRRPGPPARTKAATDDPAATESADADADADADVASDEQASPESDEGAASQPRDDDSTEAEEPPAEGEPSAEEEPSAEGEEDEGEAGEDDGEAGKDDGEAGKDDGEAEKADGEAEKAEDEAEKAEKAEKAPAEKTDSKTDETKATEPSPPLHPALVDPREGLTILQWHRRGFSEGLDGQTGSAERTTWREGDDFDLLTPGQPVRFDLARGLSARVPVALLVDRGRTTPVEARGTLEPAAPFDERAAFDYTLGDRGTRLLAVIRAWSALRHFFPHLHATGHPGVDDRGHVLLRRALCDAAEADGLERMAEILRELAAGFGDAGARLEVHGSSRPAKRWRPDVALAWVDDRVVVVPPAGESLAEGPRPGDEVVAIDGRAIEALLAERMPSTAAATASAQIARTLDTLLERADRQAEITLTVRGADEVVATYTTRARRRARGTGGDHRPVRPFAVADDGLVYVDATRMSGDAIGRRLRGRRDLRGVVVDLRGELAGRSSVLAQFVTRRRATVADRQAVGPDARGELVLEDAVERTVEPPRRPIACAVAVLVDARTRGEAEVEAAGFDGLPNVALVGSTTAGDLAGRPGWLWLPGGWRLAFTTSEVRRVDGSALWGRGVRPHVSVESSRAGVEAGTDEILEAALDRLRAGQR